MRGHRLQRPQHLQLLIAHPVGVQRHRRLHRDQAQKLQHVVLQHVPHRAGPVVIPSAPFQPHRLRHRDLHMVDDVGGPDTLEDRVREAQGHQVLDGLLAQEMVDPERL